MHHIDKIGLRIRSLREAKKYSQEYMAEMLNISQSTYACLESGKVPMRIDRLFIIAGILETDVIALLLHPDEVGLTSHHPTVLHHDRSSMEMKNVYDKLIAEMREEISFLRNLVTHATDLKT